MLRLTPLKWCAVLSAIAVLLALGLPPDPKDLEQLHTTETAYRLAIASLLIPYVFIWYTSFYAYTKLREYSAPLKKSKDGEGFRKLTLGMAVLSFSLVLSTIFAVVLSNIAAHNQSFEAASVIITNYIGLFPGMLAFLLLLNGARTLLRTAKGGSQKIDVRWHAPWFLLLAVVFSNFTIENHNRTHNYHLSFILLVLTIIVPYLYAWLVGLLSAYDLNLYAKTVKGKLYQRGIKQFANGIFIAIFGSITIQFVNVTLTDRFQESLGVILLINYALLIIVAVGMLNIALGTKKLQKIEDV